MSLFGHRKKAEAKRTQDGISARSSVMTLQDRYALDTSRDSALKTLARVEDAAVEALVSALLVNEWVLRWPVSKAVAEIPNPLVVERVIDRLVPLLEAERRSEVLGTTRALNEAGWAANALGEIGDPRAVTPLVGALQAKYPGLRRSAVVALGHIGDERAVEPLTAVLHDDYLRGDASSSISKILGSERGYALVSEEWGNKSSPRGEEKRQRKMRSLEAMRQSEESRDTPGDTPRRKLP